MVSQCIRNTLVHHMKEHTGGVIHTACIRCNDGRWAGGQCHPKLWSSATHCHRQQPASRPYEMPDKCNSFGAPQNSAVKPLMGGGRGEEGMKGMRYTQPGELLIHQGTSSFMVWLKDEDARTERKGSERRGPRCEAPPGHSICVPHPLPSPPPSCARTVVYYMMTAAVFCDSLRRHKTFQGALKCTRSQVDLRPAEQGSSPQARQHVARLGVQEVIVAVQRDAGGASVGWCRAM